MMLDLSDRVQRYMYYCGEYEPRESRFVSRFLREGDVFLDVGAHIGYYSILAARRVGPTGKVFAFEPVPANVARLRENVRLNDLRNIQVMERAVASRSGVARLFIPEVQGESGWASFFRDGSPVSVETVSIDEFVRAAAIQRIRLVKIDTEGAELEVLRGMTGTMSTAFSPAILLEVNPAALGVAKSTVGDLAGFVHGFGYAAYRLGPQGMERIDLMEDQASFGNVLLLKH